MAINGKKALSMLATKTKAYQAFFDIDVMMRTRARQSFQM